MSEGGETSGGGPRSSWRPAGEADVPMDCSGAWSMSCRTACRSAAGAERRNMGAGSEARRKGARRFRSGFECDEQSRRSWRGDFSGSLLGSFMQWEQNEGLDCHLSGICKHFDKTIRKERKEI